jgi:hypothetical protein
MSCPICSTQMKTHAHYGFKRTFGCRQCNEIICPECCKVEDGERLWVRLRRSGSELMCTSAACPRICTGVPWWAACPDGVSYGEVTPERFNRM